MISPGDFSRRIAITFGTFHHQRRLAHSPNFQGVAGNQEVPMPAYPVAAAAPVARALHRPRGPATVAAVTDHAIYVDTDDRDCPAICLATANAIRVPCALVLAGGAALPDARVGDVGLVGGGEMTLGGSAFRPARWWRPARPRAANGPSPGPLPPLEPGTAAAVARFGRALTTGAPLGGPVAALLGRGPGLTPLGDDVLAGALVALVAAGAPAGPRLAAEIMAAAFKRTTFVSAALLWHAARGECVPQLAALLAGATGAAEALRRVGATSGIGLAHGVRAARPALGEVTA
jgi:hypothetical protein